MSDELAELKARYDRLNVLYQVGSVIHTTLEPQEALQLILSQAVELMRAASGSIVLINPTNAFLEIHAAKGLPAKAAGFKLRVGEGITGWVARTGKPARVGDVRTDPRYILLRPEVRSELAVPLEVAGEVRGVLNVDADRPDAFSAEDQELLEALAAQAARVIHNTWLYEQLRLKARLFESLASVSRTINSTLNLDDALSVITREACVLMQAKVCSLMLLDETREWLELRASFGAGKAYVNRPRLSLEESLLGIVVRRKKPLQVENVQVSTRYQSVDCCMAARRSARSASIPATPTVSRTRRSTSFPPSRSCPPSPSRRRGSTSGSWMWKSSCARMKSFPRWDCWRPRWRTRFAIP
jgi:signal transduction protein with GAF and PtsI domain